MPLDFDRTILGMEFDRVELPPVTADNIRDYAEACGETDPRYTDPTDPVAPPSYVFPIRPHAPLPRDKMPTLGKTGFDAGKDVELGVPVRAGDVLTCVSTLHDIYEKTGRTGSMYFVVMRTRVTNQRDELVAVIDQKFMSR